MTKPVARVGDTGVGTCYAHPEPTDFVVTFVSGDSLSSSDGQQVCTVGCIGVTSCGHTTMALTGSSTVIGENGYGLHRVGDVGVVLEDDRGVYVVTSGSDILTAGD